MLISSHIKVGIQEYLKLNMINFGLKDTIGLPWYVQWLRIQLPMQGTQVQSLVHPWSGKIPHASGQLSPSQLVNPICLETVCSVTREPTAMRSPSLQ